MDVCNVDVCDIDVERKSTTCTYYHISIYQIMVYLVRYIYKNKTFKLNSRQKVPFFLAVFAFLTFGIGDGLTGAYMMHVCGIFAEANPFARHLVETQGCIGLIIFKLWITITLLLIVLSIERSSKVTMYWMTNGFFLALAFGGIMATTANLMRVYGTDIFGYGVPSPFSIILMYMGLMFSFLIFGNLIDNGQKSKMTYVHVRHL